MATLKMTRFARFAATAVILMACSLPVPAALITYTAPMGTFTYDSDTVLPAFNAALGVPYTHISFSGASDTDGASYSPLVTFSTMAGAYGGSNSGLVDAGDEIGPYDGWTGILNIDFNGAYVSAAGFGLVDFESTAGTIRVYDDANALIGTFNNQLSDDFSLWGIQATAGERIGRIELDGDYFAIQDIAFSQTSTSAVPEPGSLTLLGLGLVSLFAIGRRKGD